MSTITPAIAVDALLLRAQGWSWKRTATHLGVPTSTLYAAIEGTTPKPPRTLQPCGTNAAYVRHLAHREQPCTDCSRAHTAYVQKAKGRA